MSKPIVAIVGRPNVGKSTLFNVLAGDNISIVKDTPGVTRDRIYADVEWLNHKFTLVDTGGIEPESKDIILSQMRDQAQIAIDTANVIIFITDVRQGLVDADAKVADMLRRSRKPVVLVVNKVDNFDRQMMDVYEFYNLGIGEPHAISASGKLGIGDMLDEVTGYFDPEMENEEESEIPRIAIVGKPNVGKSSLVNKLLGSNRVIVSDIAGTTRDAIDTTIMHNGNEYIFIDTAGLRKKNKIKEELERYSIIRTVSAVERADVVVLLINATEGVTEQDAKIAGIAHERGKGMIIAVNKWDALEKMTRRSTALPKSKKYIGLHAVCRASFHLCEDRTASSEAVRDDRHGSAVPEPARTDRCPERDSDRGNGNAAAAVRPWKTTENLLHDTGFGQTADICYFRQRQRTDAFLLCSISGE